MAYKITKSCACGRKYAFMSDVLRRPPACEECTEKVWAQVVAWREAQGDEESVR